MLAARSGVCKYCKQQDATLPLSPHSETFLKIWGPPEIGPFRPYNTSDMGPPDPHIAMDMAAGRPTALEI